MSSPLGTRPGFRELFDAEFEYVCRALRRLGVLDADLADVAQELFVSVHDRLDEYDPSRPVKPWLFSFARGFAANYRKLARHRASPLDDEEKESPMLQTDTDARDLVLRAMDRLDFDRRTVLVMHDLEEFTAPHIATFLEIPVNTVYSRLRLARADFRHAVERLTTNGGAA
jgi:RNA polymerase sigma-70 factor, ECF subfamily